MNLWGRRISRYGFIRKTEQKKVSLRMTGPNSRRNWLVKWLFFLETQLPRQNLSLYLNNSKSKVTALVVRL